MITSYFLKNKILTTIEVYVESLYL